jgi:hypothetical protein
MSARFDRDYMLYVCKDEEEGMPSIGPDSHARVIMRGKVQGKRSKQE